MTDATWGEEWNRTIKSMPVRQYCDWVLANRPGFAPKNNGALQAWCKTWRIKDRSTMKFPQGVTA